MIHWELCKKSEFDHSNYWYMRNPESVLKNDWSKLYLDFDIPMDHLMSARRPDIIIINKNENLHNFGLYCSSLPLSKLKRKWKEG